MKRKDLYNYIREEIINELTTVTKSTETSEIPDIAKAEKVAATTVSNAVKTAKSTGKDVNIAETDLEEMANIADVLKIKDPSKLALAKEIYTTGITAKILEVLEEIGEEGITSSALAEKLGTSSNAINFIVNNLRAAGVLNPKREKMVKPEKPSKAAPETEPETDEEDDFFKADDEDATPEEKPEVVGDKELEKTVGTTTATSNLNPEEQKLVDTYKNAIANKAKILNDKKAKADDKAKARAALNSYSAKPEIKKVFTKAGLNIVDYIDSELNK